jgi:intracellular multiplication protein IcmE
LKDAGFTAAELKRAGFSAGELRSSGFSARELRAAGFSADALKQAGFDAKSLLDAGFTPTQLMHAGFSAKQLRAAGVSAAQLKDAGLSATELRAAGYTATELKAAGFHAGDLKKAGYSSDDLQTAGFPSQDTALVGLDSIAQDTQLNPGVNTIPSINSTTQKQDQAALNAQKLQAVLVKQQAQMADQRYQQKIQQRANVMLSAATQTMQAWKTVPIQAYDSSTDKGSSAQDMNVQSNGLSTQMAQTSDAGSNAIPIIKTGDVLFAVIDTAIDSDEPGPILATIVSGQLKGAKLIGSFTLPSNSDKMIITFNTLSVAGEPKTTSIRAYAIDPNTARTALSSETNHHYLSRYGALFASTFLEGFGDAFQSSNTTITVGGTGSSTDTTVQSGIGRSALENAVIGLATLGKSWGQVAQRNMSTPTTVQVFSGTSIGVLFTQDLRTI